MTATAEQPLRTTPLNALHRRLGARMVPFAGYDMPLHYSQGIIAEHLHARAHAVLFDVSHMGQATLRGDEAAEALESLVVADLKGMLAGTVRYTLLTNDQGGIIDDLMVAHGGYYLTIVVNASRKDIDFAHIAERIGQRCDFEIGHDRALLALQGPEAASVLAELAPASRHMLFMTAETLKIGVIACGVTRSGYTGEDGFEISISADDAPALADLLLEDSRVIMAGLGSRDSLRLEAGLCLYGQDIDETTTPVEAALTWTIGKRRRETGGFPGAEIILRQIAEGAARRRVGIKLDGKVPGRPGAEITDKRWTIGAVTSGGYGPSVGGPVAMGYVDADYSAAGTEVDVIVRGKPQPGRIVKLPFVPHRYVKLTS